MKKGFTLIELMIVIAIIAIIAAIAIPGLLAAQRASNERNASASLKTITTAQADFRSNDRDGNLVADYWTGDVFGLFGMIAIPGGTTAPAADGTVTTNIVRLIEPSVAGADGLSQQALYENVNFDASVGNGSPKAGYIYRALGSVSEDGVNAIDIMNDTDGGAYYTDGHDRNRFAFIAFPESLSSGKLLYAVNHDNTIWKINLAAAYTTTYTPLTGTNTNSVSSITAGVPAATGGFSLLVTAAAGTGIFPQSPAGVGFAKMD